jgi:hypothetical protein
MDDPRAARRDLAGPAISHCGAAGHPGQRSGGRPGRPGSPGRGGPGYGGPGRPGAAGLLLGRPHGTAIKHVIYMQSGGQPVNCARAQALTHQGEQVLKEAAQLAA